MMAVHVVNGPDLDLSGMGEPTTYGTATLDDLRQLSQRAAADAGLVRLPVVEVHLSKATDAPAAPLDG